jgi:hypothetical protein
LERKKGKEGRTTTGLNHPSSPMASLTAFLTVAASSRSPAGTAVALRAARRYAAEARRADPAASEKEEDEAES